MSRSADDWLEYKEGCISLRYMLRNSIEEIYFLRDQTAFDEQSHIMSRAEDSVLESIQAINEAIGSVTGGWWDEKGAQA